MNRLGKSPQALARRRHRLPCAGGDGENFGRQKTGAYQFFHFDVIVKGRPARAACVEVPLQQA